MDVRNRIKNWIDINHDYEKGRMLGEVEKRSLYGVSCNVTTPDVTKYIRGIKDIERGCDNYLNDVLFVMVVR